MGWLLINSTLYLIEVITHKHGLKHNDNKSTPTGDKEDSAVKSACAIASKNCVLNQLEESNENHYAWIFPTKVKWKSVHDFIANEYFR